MNRKIVLIICFITAVVFLVSCGEEHNYKKAVENDDIQSFESYLNSYPDGKHVKEAKERIEYLKYEQAKKTATEVSYKKYLDEYPEGKYSKEISELLYPYKKEFKGHIFAIVLLEKKDEWRLGIDSIKSKNKGDMLFIVKLRRDMDLKEEFIPKYLACGEKRYEVQTVRYQLSMDDDKVIFDELNFFVIPKNATATEFVMGDLKYNLTALEIGKKYLD